MREEILRLRLQREEQAIRRRIDGITASSRKILLPKARTLSDLMTSAIPRKWLFRQMTRVVHRWAPGQDQEALLQSFFSVSDGERDDALDVVPKPFLCEEMERHIVLSRRVPLQRNSVYFNASVHRDGTAVISAVVDQGAGSRILAVVHSRSIPGFEE